VNPWLKIALILGLLALASALSVALLLRMRRGKQAEAPVEEAPVAEAEADEAVSDEDEAALDETVDEGPAVEGADEPPEEAPAPAPEPEPSPTADSQLAGRLSRLKSRGQQEDVLAPITLTRVVAPVLPEVIDEERFPEVEGTPEEQAEAARQGELKAMIRARTKPAIGFRREFPPAQAHKVTSFFGGEPYAPADFEWPRSQATRLPLTFMAQVDCRDLPDSAARQKVPANGILYFFADLSRQSGIEDGSFVLHMETGHGPLYEHPVPDYAPRCFGADAPAAFPWIDRTKGSDTRFPRTFPKWVMTPAQIDTFPVSPPKDWDDDRPGSHEAMRAELLAQSWEKALGPLADSKPLEPEGDEAEERVWLPFASFPHNWRAVEMVAGQLLHDLQTRRIAEEKVRLLQSQANSWVERARAEKLDGCPAADDAQAFRDWLNALALRDDLLATQGGRKLSTALVSGAVAAVAALSIEQALREGGAQARAVPDEAVERVRTRHAGMLGHQMLGEGALMAGEAPTYAERHSLLMQFKADPAMLWPFSEGAWQYWILPSDLAARRFERTVLIYAGA
jgi:hypothetical protein